MGSFFKKFLKDMTGPLDLDPGQLFFLTFTGTWEMNCCVASMAKFNFPVEAVESFITSVWGYNWNSISLPHNSANFVYNLFILYMSSDVHSQIIFCWWGWMFVDFVSCPYPRIWIPKNLLNTNELMWKMTRKTNFKRNHVPKNQCMHNFASTQT